ncbi:MAG: peptidoglycan bridge formation glycyltransferase FemA/FemB family protein [Patescibacteria group bacterium]
MHPLQTTEWGEFRKEWGNEIIQTKFGLLTVHSLPLIAYKIGIFEKGPAPTKEMLRDLKKIGNSNKLIFIKLEPNVEKNKSLLSLLSKNAVLGKTLFTPTTFWIDLTKSEDELLKSFSSKTRYNIRLAQKHGVKIKINNSDEAFEKYLELTDETNKRQGFYSHTHKYHRLMWKHLNQKLIANSQEPIANLLVAKFKNEIISTWILFNNNDFLYYPYGASTDKYKEVMANNLMMWEAIRFGKSKGLKTFDLWGREEGKGFTKFKEGYNPKIVEFVGSWDLVINKPFYYLYRIAEKVRWILLRLKSKL